MYLERHNQFQQPPVKMGSQLLSVDVLAIKLGDETFEDELLDERLEERAGKPAAFQIITRREIR
jgi:hypothetical protein